MAEKVEKSTGIEAGQRTEVALDGNAEGAGGAPVFPKPFRLRSVVWGVGAMLLAVLLVPFGDQNWNLVYPFLQKLPLAGFFSAAKQIASAAAILSICVVVWALDRRRRGAVAVLLAAVLIAGGLGQAIKHTTRRARPEYGIRMSDDAKTWIREYALQHPQTAIRPEPHDQWLLLSPHPPFLSFKYNSFPSGHTVTGFVLAAFLIALYPRLAWLWLLWAAGCGLARVHGRMHYPEDVLFGAGWGWFIAQLVFSWRWPARLGDRAARRFSS